MANNPNANPIILDTDFASFTAITGYQLPLRVKKVQLVVGGVAAVAGTVTVQDAGTSNNLLAPIVVAGAAGANTTVSNDNYPTPLVWNNFKVTGLTATGTQLYIWPRLNELG